MPWRRTKVPYKILVSEVMLQQTSVGRVLPKYGEFLRAFPSIRALARSSVEEVLTVWKGLGYNRRALALRNAARIVSEKHGGRIPRTVEKLAALPGLGRATASSVLVFSFNVPIAFIETNIRRVFIHAFFPKASSVPDSRILPLVEKTLDRKNPREWYYALMDYGAWMRAAVENPNRRSAVYTRQSPFEGSLRQLRGRVLDVMLALSTANGKQIERALGKADSRLDEALSQLVSEGFLGEKGGRYFFR
ncbi:MAG: A/G-specific adenine glycosylase [Spirochaetia bacterium]